MDERSLAVVDQAASVLLRYPDDEVRGLLPVVGGAVDLLPACPARTLLAGFVAHAAAADPRALAAEYVETFDFRRGSCLYLTYYADGDTRRRGMALARLKVRYRHAGLEVEGGELPDFLPVVLEFAAATGDRTVLADHRVALEVLRRALTETGSAYAAVVEAVCGTLPAATDKDREAAVALAAAGPPREEVGLEPYPTGGVGSR